MWLIFVFVVVIVVLVFVFIVEVFLIFFFGVFVTGAFVLFVWSDPMEMVVCRMGWFIAGFIYVGGVVVVIGKLYYFLNGGIWVVLSMVLAWGSDMGGYFVGCAFGKYKFYVKIFLKKIIEGVIGGFVVVMGFVFVICFFWLFELLVVEVIVFVLIVGVIG